MNETNIYPIIFVAAGIFLLAEVSLLLMYRHYRKRGIDCVSIISNAGAGGCLLFAAWLATMQASPVLLCVAVSGAFLCHAIDQTMRWNA
ncbi:MAG: hypothetical protein AAF404_01370 [Pseudomonadota bacterium]